VTKNVLYALIISLAFLVVLEGAARLLELPLRPAGATERPGWQTEFFGSLFDWHEPDPSLLWRFKAHLDNPLIRTNSHHLLGGEVAYQKPPQTCRILVLGDSSPVGLGLADRRQTFAELLRYALDIQFRGRKNVEVINAAVSGYTSEQVVRFLEHEGWRYDPDLVIVYCGNNDASISGIYDDRLLLDAQRFRVIRSLLGHSALYRLLRAALAGSSPDAGAPSNRLVVRVSPRQFEENMQSIARQCRQHSCPLVILKPPVPYLWPAGLQFKPFLHLTGTEGQIILPAAITDFLGSGMTYCIDENRFRELYGQGDIFTCAVYQSAGANILPPDSAVAYYLAKTVEDSRNPLYYNNLGVAYWRSSQNPLADAALREARRLFNDQHLDDTSPATLAAASPILYNIGINLLTSAGDSGAVVSDTATTAFAYLDSALQADYLSLRIKRPYWDAIDRLNGQSDLAVIDLPALFRQDKGERLFIDHCHPTPEGHRLIARAIFDTIAERKWCR
jgi:lysophospholipase L1-like esterase